MTGHERGQGISTPPPLPRRTPPTSPNGSPVASPLPAPRMGGHLAVGHGGTRTNVAVRDGGVLPNARSRHDIWPPAASAAQNFAPVGRMEYQVLGDTQARAEMASSVPPPVPQHYGRASTVKYADLDHSGYPSGRYPSPVISLRQMTSYSQISHAISDEDGRQLPILTDGNGHESSSDEEFDYDVPPSITNLRRLQSDDRHSPSPHEDLYNVPRSLAGRETSPFNSDPTYDSPPTLSPQEFQHHRPVPPLPVKGSRTAPPVPAHKHSSLANHRAEEELYDHPRMNNRNEVYDVPLFRPQQQLEDNDEPEYDPVAPDQLPLPPVPGRTSNQTGVPLRSGPVMPVHRVSTMISRGYESGVVESHRPRSASSGGHMNREISIQHLINRGYTRDQVVRALAVSQNDFKMAERILEEFGK